MSFYFFILLSRVRSPAVHALHVENKIDAKQVSQHATKTKQKPQPPSRKRKMKSTLLLLSLVAIALMSGTEAQPIWNGEQAFDEMDDDGCSTRNFDRVLVATVEITGRAPNPACARAVFDKICDQCEDNIRCYLELGRQVGPMTRQCQPRRLRVSVPDY